MKNVVVAAAVGAMLAATLAMGATLPAHAAGERIAVVTPFLAAVATKQIADSFGAEAQKRGWSVDQVDTGGDMGAFASRIEDETAAHVKALVLLSVNAAQVQAQVDKAKAAGIPVVTIDGAKNPSVALNVTSDNHALGKTMTDYLFKAIGGSGGIVRLFYSAHPGVHQREVALDEAEKANPAIREVAQHYVQVPGQVEDSRAAMDAILLANPAPDAIKAVWAAWDEPGIGAKLSIDAAGRKGVVIAGVDGNPQAIDLIRACSPYIATVRQDFEAMSRIAADGLSALLAGGPAPADEQYAPGQLITRESLGVTCAN